MLSLRIHSLWTLLLASAALPLSASGMQKVVTSHASFVLYVPAGWKSTEDVQGMFRTLTANDPANQSRVIFSVGVTPQGATAQSLARQAMSTLSRERRGLELRSASASHDGARLVFEGTFDGPGGLTEFRSWVALKGGECTVARIEAPASQFQAQRAPLLTILANIRLIKGAMQAGGGTPRVSLVTHRMGDGSASFLLPSNWRCQDVGRGKFLSGDGAGSAFISGGVNLITPKLGVRVPGTLVSPYLRPSEAWRFITGSTGLARNLRFDGVKPLVEMTRSVAKVYTAGQVQAEEFTYEFDSKEGVPSRGFTFAFSFGDRLGTNWSFHHLTVTAPANRFGALAGTFAAMLESYRINEKWAADYVARGAQRLREMQQQTAALVARNAQEIRTMMQAAYNERARSQDYIDYQRTSYIRGQQDWISQQEGGAIYRSDSWGTQNLATGGYASGSPYDYVHFDGRNARTGEQMQAIDSRALWEKHVR